MMGDAIPPFTAGQIEGFTDLLEKKLVGKTHSFSNICLAFYSITSYQKFTPKGHLRKPPLWFNQILKKLEQRNHKIIYGQ